MNDYNKTYQGEIITRFLSEENFKGFHEDYVNSRKRRMGTQNEPPTPKQLEMAEEFKNGIKMTVIAEKEGLRYSTVVSAVAKVSMFNYLSN